MVLLTSPVRSANSARLKAPSPRRNAVNTASARSAADTPLRAGRPFSACFAISILFPPFSPNRPWLCNAISYSGRWRRCEGSRPISLPLVASIVRLGGFGQSIFLHLARKPDAWSEAEGGVEELITLGHGRFP